MQQEDFWVPRTLDDPPMMLFFQADTFILFIVIFLLTIPFSIVAAAVLAMMVCRLYVQLKENGDKGLISQLAYWYTPSDMWLSPFWNSSVREYSGR